jgi:hypothetical protein
MFCLELSGNSFSTSASMAFLTVDCIAAGSRLVSYQMNLSAQQQFTTIGSGWGWDWGSDFATTTEQTIFTGTLIINMTDSRRNQLVFQGVSSGPISSRAQKNAKRLQRGVNKIFEKYPPQP